MLVVRGAGLALFAIALVWAQFGESDSSAAHLELATEPLMPARVYLFKDNRPFRLSPVEALLPLRLDLFYRDHLLRNSANPNTLEVTFGDDRSRLLDRKLQSHFVLLKGIGKFDLPAGHYRVEAYRGHFFVPAVEEFDLKAGETRVVALRLRNWAGAARDAYVSGDGHIHVTRSRDDNDVFLAWLAAEDLHVGNFLLMQRQMEGSVQYAFGPQGEARRSGHLIRTGQESRSEFYGHVNLLGGREPIRPVSIGPLYGNSMEAYPYPGVLFLRGRNLGATVGYAHLNGSMPHSTLLMDLALSRIDFVEILQWGVLKTELWYELLNAGLRVTGVAGSDFPVSVLRNFPPSIPLFGPERTLVKARAGVSPYEAWAAGVRSGNAMVTNGPLVTIEVDEAQSKATATAKFYRPIETLEIVRNGRIIASILGEGPQTELSLSTRIDNLESCWIAARVKAHKEEGEPDIQAHTNAVYVLRDGKPVLVRADRESLAQRWEAEMGWYRGAGLVFGNESNRRQFFADAELALTELRRPLELKNGVQ